MHQNIYFNFYAIGFLILDVFYVVTSLFCLTIHNKTKGAFHLGTAYFLAGIICSAYIISFIWYDPISSIHRYFSICFAIANVIHICQFILCFPYESHPKVRRIFLISMWSVLFAVVAVFIWKSKTAPYIYRFDGHNWDFALDDLSKGIGVMILFYVLVTIISGFWRTYIIKGRERWSVFLITISFIIVSIIPAIINIVSRDGAIERDYYFLSMNFLNMLGYFIIFIIFINYTKDRTSFMAKIMSISLVTILLLLFSLGYYTSQVVDSKYNEAHVQQVPRVLIDERFRPKDIEYIVQYSIDKDLFEYKLNKNNIQIDFVPYKNEILNIVLWERINSCREDNFKKDIHEVLDKAHPSFAGYKRAILEYLESVSEEEQKPDQVLAYIKALKRVILYQHNKIESLPDKDFKILIKNYLHKMDKKLEPFIKEISLLLKSEELEGSKLKQKVLSYLDAMNSPEERNYRKDITDKNHFVTFMYVDVTANKIYEVGFSYLLYRKYIHPDSLILVFLLGFVLFVILVLFRFFFRGALVNPLYSLVDGLIQVGKGNLDIKVPIKVEDEIGFLTHNFNNMVEVIKTSKKQIDDYTNNLEEKVNQRTEELQAAMEELGSMNEMLVKARDELWGEMQLAKKIQTVLLPRKPEIPGYEITVFMEPADEVGGDYYDIINISNRDWIVIGDVSGHGVPAGLVMMMVQTAIKVTLDCNPGLKPSELLSIINRTITKNIKMMYEDKYMTITVFACIEKGFLIFSGLHQDIMVYRAEKDIVEKIETDGMWLGLLDNIDGMVQDDKLILNQGDTVMLYTDGITESCLTDSSGKRKMYGLEKLSDVFYGCSKKSTEEIKNEILHSLKQYEIRDDITLVILRRLN